MDQDLVARRRRELSKRQAIFVAARERGLDREASAVMAGYPKGQDAGEQVEQSANVQEELARARAELAADSGITKEDVLAGLKKAAEIAQTMADPQAMVRAWSEIGKMLGFYAPEVKKHLVGLDQETRDALRDMSDEQLLKLANGRVLGAADGAEIKKLTEEK